MQRRWHHGEGRPHVEQAAQGEGIDVAGKLRRRRGRAPNRTAATKQRTIAVRFTNTGCPTDAQSDGRGPSTPRARRTHQAVCVLTPHTGPNGRAPDHRAVRPRRVAAVASLEAETRGEPSPAARLSVSSSTVASSLSPLRVSRQDGPRSRKMARILMRSVSRRSHVSSSSRTRSAGTVGDIARLRRTPSISCGLSTRPTVANERSVRQCGGGGEVATRDGKERHLT